MKHCWRAGLLTLILCCLGAPAQARIYKWVDDNGLTHYSETAPQGVKATVIRSKSDTSSDTDAAQQRLDKTRKDYEAAASQRADKSSEKATSPKDKVAQDTSEKCKKWRESLDTMTNHNQVRIKEKDGQLRVLGEEERQAQITQAKKNIADFCNE
jgi:hypothetical protein